MKTTYAAFAGLVLSLLIVGCGGGSQVSGPEVLLQSHPSALNAGPLASLAAVRPHRTAALRTPDTGSFFNWAESAYPALFPAPQSNKNLDVWTYRYYPSTDIYLGVNAAGDVLGLVGKGAGAYESVALGKITDFACSVFPSDCVCDQVATLAAAPRTATDSNIFEPTPAGQNLAVIERWALTIDGEAHQLNVAIATPPKGTAIRGVVINGHGTNPNQTAEKVKELPQPYWDAQMTSRGYISVTVARRGNFGSTGSMLIPVDISASNYYSATFQMMYFKYQAASLVAALSKMSTDPVYQSHLHTILLQGASGGSDTVIQTSVDSAVFKAATRKAVIRFSGGVGVVTGASGSIVDTMDEYMTIIGKDAVSSLWIAGEKDPRVLPSQTACQFKFFHETAKTAGYTNTFYVVPGMDHQGVYKLFTPPLRQIFREYMASRGFDGFN